MKNKIINITIIVMLIIFISFRISIACEELQKDSQNFEYPVIDLPAAFTGSLPEISSSETVYYLELNQEHFKEVTFYRDNKLNSSVTAGTWTQSADTLYLFTEDDEILKRFRYVNNQLILLQSTERNGSDGLYALNTVGEFASITNHHKNLKDEGVNFVASGNEPFWSFRIDSDGNLNYREPDFSTSEQLEERSREQSSFEFSIRKNSSDINIEVNEGYCIDSMSGFLFTHSLTLFENGKAFYGCGKYL